MSADTPSRSTDRSDSRETSRVANEETASSQQQTFLLSPPPVGLPKGGGAIRGIGEKFATNPVTGSATFSIPIPAPPGRAGFGPRLQLTYDSGRGNGPFGFGCALSSSAISITTEKGLPRYLRDLDTYSIAGAEDLVPTLDEHGRIDDDTESTPGYTIRRYRPRIEGLFARIERWTRDDGDVHWRSTSSDNVLSIFGKDGRSRIADPADATRVFSWLISETRDDKGNAIVFDYKSEDASGVDLTQDHELNRGDRLDPARTANRYVTRIRYGNRQSLLDAKTRLRPRDLTSEQLESADWMFELRFDYGEHGGFEPVGSETWRCRPDLDGQDTWAVRPDPFSTYRAGFEVRTYRLCRRVLMIHHFPSDGEVGEDCLVRSLELLYRDDPEEPAHSDPGFSFVTKIAQRSYQRDPDDTGLFHYRSSPPVDLAYTEANVDSDVRELDPEGLENLPVGVGGGYQWIDLDGEGLPGILTEQAGGWFYKANLGRGPSGPTFAPVQVVAPRPSLAALSTGQQLLDLVGGGRVALVEFAPPLAGFHQRDDQGEWNAFVPFDHVPNIDWNDPNLRFLDLTGDGHADVLITEQDAFTWYESESIRGFGAAARNPVARDERDGPRVVFADQDEAIYLADMSGDGLSDIVRIRNGQVCYWPNHGYGRFGRQVLMDGSPRFDSNDQFEQRRVRLADVDGSGAVDLIYLGRDGATVWLNRSGNGWSGPRDLRFPVATGNVDQVHVSDLFGNGTACLVWSSALPADARLPMLYLDLMGGVKPHLLKTIVNNLGVATTVTYAASTKYYLQDKAAGTLWATKLPFPVQCVDTLTVEDFWRRTVFSTSYSYHHGYFDAVEREFRGFGRVEHVDTQRVDDFTAVNDASPYVTQNSELYQPPVKTITWYHTGVGVDRQHVLDLFSHEYFPSRFAPRLPAGTFVERELPQPEIERDAGTPPLDTGEWLEAARACKGMVLREEAYELDLATLSLTGEHKLVRLFSAAEHNCHVRRLQARGVNKYDVFLVSESEAIAYNYELALGGNGTLDADPRVTHTLNLRFDDYGRPRQSVAVGYPRVEQYADDPDDSAPLTDEQLALVRAVQNEAHVTYSETAFTAELPSGGDHRLPAPCEAQTFEVVGLSPAARAGEYLTLDVLRGIQWNPVLDVDATVMIEPLEYQQRPQGGGLHMRLVQHAATLYFKDDLSGALYVGQPSRLGLTYENYELALTESLLHDVLTTAPNQDDFAAEALAVLALPGARADFYASGYQNGDLVLGAEGGGQWWTRSGVAGFAADAADHFFLPTHFFDPFGNPTTLAYDPDYLFVASSVDAVDNTTTVVDFNHRALAPSRIRDANGNESAVAFDILALPVAMALMGKVSESGLSQTGDTLEDFSLADLNPDPDQVDGFFAADSFAFGQARTWLGKATTRFVYHFGEIVNSYGDTWWGATPASSCAVTRERHEADAPNTPEADIPVQVSVEYSDGVGQTFVRKVQAEPDPADALKTTRWIANGRTVVNNKGTPVLKYEPYFSASDFRFEEPLGVGVSPVMYYDAPGRLVRTDFPDGSVSRVQFSPWFSRSFDQNDTVLEPKNRWYERHADGAAPPEDQRAAALAALHAATPSETHVDSLGRSVIAIARNRVPVESLAPLGATTVADWPWKEERHLTFTKLDAEGKALWICDALGNLVMQYITPPQGDHTPLNDPVAPDYKQAYFMPAFAVTGYDMGGTPLFQHSMDAGDRRQLMDATGQPMLAWDYNERMDATSAQLYKEHRRFRVLYDGLHRPIERWLRVRDEETGATGESLVERFRYGEGVVDDTARNLRGQPWQHYDGSGLAQTDAIDLSGKPLVSRRRLARDIEAPVVDWSAVLLEAVFDADAGVEDDVFTQRNEYDALGRIVTLCNWHIESAGSMGGEWMAVYRPEYNERGVLAKETLFVRAVRTPATSAGYGVQPGLTRQQQAIVRIDYNARGQKTRIDYGNGTMTSYDYDPDTFRLRELRTTRPGFNPAFPSTRGQLADPRVLQHLFYTYDPSGNITDIWDDAWTPAFFSNQKIDPAGSYVYDAVYRLLEATGREDGHASGAPPHSIAPVDITHLPVSSGDALSTYIERYTHDAVGNIRKMRHLDGPARTWTRLYGYATDSNQLTVSNTDNPLQAVNYGYDVHGSMLNFNASATDFDLRWDWNDMIHAINLGGGGRAWYQYGTDKQRCRKRIDKQNHSNGYWERIYLGGYELYRRYSGAANTLVEVIESHHLFEGEQRVLLVDDVITPSDAAHPRPDGLTVQRQTLFRYQYSNHLGSACLEADDQAAIISYEEYHPYGTTAFIGTVGAREAPNKRYRFTGMERDEESALSYHRARFYIATCARWTSVDPNGVRSGPNLYRYTTNPLSFVDPTGRTEVVNPSNKDDWDTVKRKAVEAWQQGVDAKDRSTRFFLELRKKYTVGISGAHAWNLWLTTGIPIEDIWSAADKNDTSAGLLNLFNAGHWIRTFNQLFVPGVPVDKEALVTASGLTAKVAEAYLQASSLSSPEPPSLTGVPTPSGALALDAEVSTAGVKAGTTALSAAIEELPEGTHGITEPGETSQRLSSTSNSEVEQAQAEKDRREFKKNMKDAYGNPNPGEDDHHIVPFEGGGEAGDELRQILKDVGINPRTDARNGVRLTNAQRQTNMPRRWENTSTESHGNVHTEANLQDLLDELRQVAWNQDLIVAKLREFASRFFK